MTNAACGKIGRMVEFAYVSFVLALTVLGALLGIFAHFWRAHATRFAEDLGLGEPLDTLTREDYQWEKHVVGAEWDDAGFWASDSVRNLLYYMLSGAGAPLLFGAVFWAERRTLVDAACQGLWQLGLEPPLCF